VRTTKRNGAKRQNGRIKSRTVNMRTGRAAAQRAEQTKKITRKIQSPSIMPERQQTEPMGSTNSRKPELYMVNEAEYIRSFGW
jgi:hypothetical protein